MSFPPCNNFAKLLSILLSFFCCAFTIDVTAQLTANFTADKQGGCSPLNVKFTNTTTGASATATWQWTFGNGGTSKIQSPSIKYAAAGNYTISLTAANKLGCSDIETHLVNVVALPTAIAGANPITIISGGSITLNMNYTGPIINYNWLPTQNLDCTNCPAPVANPQFTTNYAVQVQDRFGCKNTGYITVQVACNGQNFFIPNTFSPNGDGSNDIFYLRGTGLFRVKAFRVFNRWGELVFEKREVPVNNSAYGWDGTYKGKKGQADVYIYQVEILCSNGELIKYAGNIALLQ